MEFIAACDSYVIWKFDEQNITNDTNYIITIRRIKQFYYKALLEVKQSSKDDAGNYTVTIMSTAGNYNINILVSITESGKGCKEKQRSISYCNIINKAYSFYC